jgi:uncharacterized metal-binding protein YceD (DUF177 family)
MLSFFEISVLKLKDGKHQYDFELKKDFFEFFNFEDIHDAELKVMLTLNKGSRVIMAKFDIHGTVSLLCDRSLEVFEEKISCEETVAYKYGETEEVLSDELIQITASTQSVNVARQLFEMTVFSLPMKKLHPKFRSESDTNDTLVYSSSDIAQDDEKKDDDTNAADPRFSSLKNLKDKFNNLN